MRTRYNKWIIITKYGKVLIKEYKHLYKIETIRGYMKKRADIIGENIDTIYFVNTYTGETYVEYMI